MEQAFEPVFVVFRNEFNCELSRDRCNNRRALKKILALFSEIAEPGDVIELELVNKEN